jgi:hypothetical protein
MPPDHYAVVIGISSYPKLGDPPPADLKGPGVDADSVVTWLTGPGGVPLKNISLIRSSDCNSPPDAAPTRDDIHEKTFLWLDKLAEANQAATGRRAVGARLYVYVSGHGFSPRFNQGCLLAGNAAERQYSANVFPSAWIDWLQDAGYFREFVLLMDCCMDRQVLTQPTPPPLDPIGTNTAPGPSFVAFAASRPLKAVEKQIPEDGQNWHGIFTWNLLQGLRGAARNSRGNVTGASLANWLRQAQLGWLDDADRRSPDISKEPAILDEDESLILARNVSPLQFDVMLRFPATVPPGVPARLWSGTPPAPGADFLVDPNGVKLRLQPGFYLAEVKAGGLRHGFTVTRSGDITLSEQGPGPLQTAESFTLTVNPNDATAEIRVMGSDFSVEESGNGSLSAKLPAGLYQIRIRIGRQIVEKVILLDSDWPTPAGGGPAQALPALPTISSAAPLPESRATHEYQQAAARDGIARIDISAGNGAQLMVMARSFSPSGGAAVGMHPWDGVKVFDTAGRLLGDMTVAGDHRGNPGEDPVGVCSFALDPGSYILRHCPGVAGAEVALSLVLPPGGWRLEVYLLRYVGSLTVEAAKARISVIMHPMAAPWASGEDILAEKARVALADENPILNAELAEVLFRKTDNPLAGIIGGHLLLVGNARDPQVRIDDLNEIVKNLRGLLGSDHPDVEALSLACPDTSLRRTQPVLAPPMFERSWRMLVKESQRNPAILPLALWQQVHAAIVAPPFLIWSADDAVQKDFRKALAEAAFGAPTAEATAAPAGAAAPAAAMAMPAAAMAAPGGVETLPAPATAAEPPPPRANLAASLGLPPVAMAALAREFAAGS